MPSLCWNHFLERATPAALPRRSHRPPWARWPRPGTPDRAAETPGSPQRQGSGQDPAARSTGRPAAGFRRSARLDRQPDLTAGLTKPGSVSPVLRFAPTVMPQKPCRRCSGEGQSVTDGFPVRCPRIARSTRMTGRTIWARLRARHPGPSRVQDRDGHSSRPHRCIARKWAHRGLWRPGQEEGASAAHTLSRAPVRRSFRSRDAAIPGPNGRHFCKSLEGTLRVHPKYVGQPQGALPISCMGLPLLPA